MRSLNMPLTDEAIRSLKVGDPVLLNGIMITGRDAAHKWMVDTFIKQTATPRMMICKSMQH
jgi:tartrate dehydratase beta subunit/fumarate hydratase class I family protein